MYVDTLSRVGAEKHEFRRERYKNRIFHDFWLRSDIRQVGAPRNAPIL